jgi:hypothetical protein
MLNRHNPRERFMLGCLLVALMVGIVAVKFWVVSVEERMDATIEILWSGVRTDNSQNNTLESHERRLRRVERTAWAVWDHHAPCDGWPTQQQIAKANDE